MRKEGYRKQISFFIDEETFKEFSIKCIQKNTKKTTWLVEQIEKFIKEK